MSARTGAVTVSTSVFAALCATNLCPVMIPVLSLSVIKQSGLLFGDAIATVFVFGDETSFFEKLETFVIVDRRTEFRI